MRTRLLTCGPLVTLALAGCGVPAEVVARVGGHEIRLEQAQHYVEAITDGTWQDVDARVASRLFDEFLEQTAASVLLDDEVVNGEAEPGRRWDAVRKYAEEKCGPAPTVSIEDGRTIAEARMTAVVPARVLLRQLLLSDAEVAAEAFARLSEGEDFELVSREMSRAPNAGTGGDLGWVVQGTQPEDIESVIFALEAGEISRPVEGPGGFHLFQALEVRPEGAPQRDLIENEIRRELEDRAQREHLRWCIDNAVDSVGVEVFTENLWFEYKGRFAEARDDKNS